MPEQELLILALTRMRSGICTAGMTLEPDPVTGLRWVRPVRDFDTVLLGDMTTTAGQLLQCGDVAILNLLTPRPQPPHVEDWVTDFVRVRPRLARRLQGDRRAQFFAEHLDHTPADVLCQHTRSLCLVQPQRVWASFTLDPESNTYEARMGFELAGDANHPRALASRGVAVTDLKWRALGRVWLGGASSLSLEHAALLERLTASSLYLAVGLSRNWAGEHWPLVVGVHSVPDFDAVIDPQFL